MEPTENPELRELIDQHFVPAADASEATVKLSTVDFFKLIERHAPGSFYVEELARVLKSAGYRTTLIGEDLLWLARAR